MSGIDMNTVIEQISFSSKFIAITIVIGGLLKVLITNYFLVRLEQTRQSKIIIKRDGKIFTSTRQNESGSIQVFKSLNEDTDEEEIEKTWRNVS